MKKIELKNIMLAGWSEYIKWLCSPKLLVLVAVYLPMRRRIILPLMRASQIMDSPLNVLEGYLGVVNNWMGIILLSAGYMVSISGFPSAEGNLYYYVPRMGRRNWILGEIVFQIMSVFTYCALAVLITCMQVAGRSFLDNGWSLVVTDFDELYEGKGTGIHVDRLIPPRLNFQVSPYRAFFLGSLLLFLFLMLCGLIFLTGCLYQKRTLFFVIQIMHIVAGGSAVLLKSRFMWMFPITHALFAAHYKRYFREYVFSPWISLGILSGLLILIGILMYQRAKKVSMDLL